MSVASNRQLLYSLFESKLQILIDAKLVQNWTLSLYIIEHFRHISALTEHVKQAFW